MKLVVEVISNEIVVPSSPTPDHLRHYKLSLIDQLSPKTYNPLIYFYEIKCDEGDHSYESKVAEISGQIKKSLSEALTLFYPLGGRVRKNRFVECNDEGILFSQTRVKNPVGVSEFVRSPNRNPSDLSNLLPFERINEVTEYPVGVRLNVFEKGGIALGLCITHQLADGLSYLVFVKTWVAVSRGATTVVDKPRFNSAELFPPRENPGFDPNSRLAKAVVSRRFVFDASTVEEIRSKYEERAKSENERRPSRVEALSAFIWTRFVASNHGQNKKKKKKVYAMILPVNIRPKLDPPAPQNSFGNLYRLAASIFPVKEALSALNDEGQESYGYEVVKRVREGIESVGSVDFLKKVREGQDPNMKRLIRKATRLAITGREMDGFTFTSLCRFPLYEADFGWGDPLWVSSAPLSFHNMVAFLDAKMGDGIEAYIGLKEDCMAKLEADEEFLKYVKN